MKFKDNADITTLLLGGKINIWIDTDKGSKYLDLILIPPTIEKNTELKDKVATLESRIEALEKLLSNL